MDSYKWVIWYFLLICKFMYQFSLNKVKIATIFLLLFRIKKYIIILYSESPMLWHTWKVILLNSEKGLYFKSLYIYSVKWIKLMWCVNLAEIILYNEKKDIYLKYNARCLIFKSCINCNVIFTVCIGFVKCCIV